MAYLGPSGNLVRFKDLSALEITAEREATYRTTLSGVRKAQRAKTSRRVWNVSIGAARPDEVAALGALVDGLYGPPPWVFVEPWMMVTNMLSPAESMPGAGNPGTWGGDAVAGGTVELVDATRPTQSLLSGGGDVLFGSTDIPVPVEVGSPITFAVSASGSAVRLRISFLDATGAIVSNSQGLAAASAVEPLPRHHLTVTAPEGAVSAYAVVDGASKLALPAFTWTGDPVPWTRGNGAPKVTVDGLGEAVVMAVRDEALGRFAGYSFSVMEVG